MILASDIKPGMALHLDGKLFKVLEIVRHAGSGQMHGFIELKLKDIRFSHFVERRFKLAERLEEVELAKQQMEYLYADTDALFFMDPDTFEQVGIPKTAAGGAEKFIKEGSRVTVEMLGGEAVSMDFPKVVEMRVASTGPGIRGGQDNTMKSAVLENGVEVLVPHFVETGDMVRVDAEKAKYIDRVTTKRM
jgi:elongation factor P